MSDYRYPSDTTNAAPIPQTVVQVSRETPSSIEIGQNSKGEPTYTVKLYAECGFEMARMYEALDIVSQLRERLGLPPLAILCVKIPIS